MNTVGIMTDSQKVESAKSSTPGRVKRQNKILFGILSDSVQNVLTV